MSREHELSPSRVGDVLELEEHGRLSGLALKATRIIDAVAETERARCAARCRAASSRCWRSRARSRSPTPSEWAYEIKWDGIRALGYADHGSWWMLSRRLEDVSARYPELEPIAEALGERSAILDGEVVALDDEGRPRFQLIQSRMGLTSPARSGRGWRRQPVDYVIFDLLHLDGHSVRELPYVAAPRAARGARARRPPLADPRLSLGGGADLLEAARRQGLEGIVAKRTESPYRPGKRTGEWIKTRVWKRQEFVIGGYIPGEGRRAKRVGSLLVGYYDRRAPSSARATTRRCTSPAGSAPA